VLMAQTLYVRRNGNFIDRLLYRIWLLRCIRKSRRSGSDRRIWKETVIQAFLLRVPKQPRPAFLGESKDKRFLT
jgi:hypothetical protein